MKTNSLYRPLSLLALLFSTSLLFAAPALAHPGIAWIYNPQTPNVAEIIRNLSLDDDGNIIGVGMTRNSLENEGRSEMLQVLVGSDGVELQRHTYSSDLDENGYDVAFSDSGATLLGTQTILYSTEPKDPVGQTNPNESWGYRVATDPSGAQTAGEAIQQYQLGLVADAVITNNGNFLLISNLIDRNVQPENLHSLATLTNQQGEIVWQSDFDFANDIRLEKIIETSDGGFLLLAATSPSFFLEQPYLEVIKIDGDGFTEFINTYPGVVVGMSDGFAVAADEDTDGSFVIVSSTSVNGGGSKLIWFNRISALGEELGRTISKEIITHQFDPEKITSLSDYDWEKVLHTYDQLYTYALIPGQNGGWLLGGGLLTFRNNQQYRPYLARLDANGRLIGELLFDEMPYTVIKELIATPDGGYVTCIGHRLGSGHTTRLVKLDSDNFELAMSQTITVAIQIHNPKVSEGSGLVEVAVLSTPEFDATAIDPETVLFAGAAVARQGHDKAKVKDTNGDKRDDLILNFRMDKLQLASDTTVVLFEGQTTDGLMVQGSFDISAKIKN